jgi:hypothetical protein
MTFRSAHNRRAIDAVIAIGRAHARLPGFDRPRALALVGKLDAAMDGVRTMECIVALVMQLLRALGVNDFADESRFTTRN